MNLLGALVGFLQWMSGSAQHPFFRKKSIMAAWFGNRRNSLPKVLVASPMLMQIKAVVRQNPVTFLPGAVQNVVHFTISCGIVFSLEIFPDFGILGKKDFVPHLNHRIGRRGDDELHGSVGNKGQIRRRRIYDFVKTLHYWDLPSVFRAFCHICGRSVLSLCCIEAGSQDPLRIPAKRTGIFCSLLCRGRQSILRPGQRRISACTGGRLRR